MPSDSVGEDFLDDLRQESLPERSGLPDRVAFIRTSDRSTWRRCRRKFNWSYLHRGNRGSRGARDPLWLGTGFHYAMEDFHGYKRFPTAADALKGFALACKRTKGMAVPEDWQELTELGSGMLDYYEEWLRSRDALTTLVIDGIPQVEVRFQIPIQLDPDFLNLHGFDRAIYTGTIDRVCIDEYQRVWGLDYKTAKIFRQVNLDMDNQINAYSWALHCLFGHAYEIGGFIYQSHKKQVPHEPEFLKGTKMFSVAKNQVTTYALYAKALRNLYGSVEAAPSQNIQYLNLLMEQESDRADKIIKREFAPRNEHQIASELPKILSEASEMLNPSLPIYPNPTNDCVWDCDFRMACLNLDDGSDWQFELENSTQDRAEQEERWRQHLVYPAEGIY